MHDIGGYEPGLIQVDVPWKFKSAFEEDLQPAQAFLRRVFSQAHQARGRWNEKETIRRIIYPVLRDVLAYPSDDISETIDPAVYYKETRLEADFVVRDDLVVEAKKMKTPLLAWARADADFSNAVDQGLTYLDNYNSKFCIISNGWDWYLFQKAQNWDQLGQMQTLYFGIRFRLDEAAASADLTQLGWFVSIFNNASLAGLVNQQAVVRGCSLHQLYRNMYRRNSLLYFRNFSDSPMKSHGSGFRWSSDR